MSWLKPNAIERMSKFARAQVEIERECGLMNAECGMMINE